MSFERLQNQFEEINDALNEEVEDRDPEVVDENILSFYRQDTRQWYCVFKGQDKSNMEGGQYKIKIVIPKDYPDSPPECYMTDGFQHFHIYPGGKVCYRWLNKESWKITYTILILLNGIIRMLHSEPNYKDPAATELADKVKPPKDKNSKPDFKEYDQFMKKQALKFSNRYDKEKGKKRNY